MISSWPFKAVGLSSCSGESCWCAHSLSDCSMMEDVTNCGQQHPAQEPGLRRRRLSTGLAHKQQQHQLSQTVEAREDRVSAPKWFKWGKKRKFRGKRKDSTFGDTAPSTEPSADEGNTPAETPSRNSIRQSIRQTARSAVRSFRLTLSKQLSSSDMDLNGPSTPFPVMKEISFVCPQCCDNGECNSSPESPPSKEKSLCSIFARHCRLIIQRTAFSFCFPCFTGLPKPKLRKRNSTAANEAKEMEWPSGFCSLCGARIDF